VASPKHGRDSILSPKQKLWRLSVAVLLSTVLVGMGSLTATIAIFVQGVPADEITLFGFTFQPYRVIWGAVGLGVWIFNLVSLSAVTRLWEAKPKALRAPDDTRGWSWPGRLFTVLVGCVGLFALVMVWNATREFTEGGKLDNVTEILREDRASAQTIDPAPLREARQRLQDELDLITEPENKSPSQALRDIRRGAATVQAKVDAAEAAGDVARFDALQPQLISAKRADDLTAEIKALDARILAAQVAPTGDTARADARAAIEASRTGIAKWVHDNQLVLFASLAELLVFCGVLVYVMLREREADRERLALLDASKDSQVSADAAEAAQRAAEAAANAARAQAAMAEAERQRLEEERMRAEEEANRLRKEKNRPKRGLPPATPEELAAVQAAKGDTA
jgi:hypothetical protein